MEGQKRFGVSLLVLLCTCASMIPVIKGVNITYTDMKQNSTEGVKIFSIGLEPCTQEPCEFKHGGPAGFEIKFISLGNYNLSGKSVSVHVTVESLNFIYYHPICQDLYDASGNTSQSCFVETGEMYKFRNMQIVQPTMLHGHYQLNGELRDNYDVVIMHYVYGFKIVL